MYLVVRRMRPAQLEGPERVLVIHHCADPSEVTVFRAHAPPQGPCQNLMRALTMLANLQAGGDNLADTQEQSRLKITSELRRFIEVGNHEA